MTKGSDFDNLPSKANFYNKFESSGEACESECEGEITKYNLGSGDFNNCRDRIKRALAYLLKVYGKNKEPYNSEPYHFFYYWIGKELFGSTHSTLVLPTKVGTVSGTINNYCGKNGVCGLPFNNHPKQDIFNNRKTLFDFWYDYGALLTLLESSKFPNVETCENYYQNVEGAKSEMEAHCMSDGSDEYCQNFWERRKEDIKDKLSKLKSTLAAAKQSIESEAQLAASKREEAVRGATTTSSISSIIGTLATTAVPFLLYKYKPWSSWFRNHSGNGGRSSTRKRRSTERNIDELTETSTVDFTESSETSSTIDGSTVRPAAYIGQLNGRRNNNAGGRGMVGYQNM